MRSLARPRAEEIVEKALREEGIVSAVSKGRIRRQEQTAGADGRYVEEWTRVRRS